MLIDLHLGVLALFQPGTSEVKLSDSYSLKEFVFTLKFSQNRKFLSRNEQNSGIHGLFFSQLQSSNSLLTWTAGKVWMMSPKPGRGQEQMWASQMDPVNNGLNHRGRPVHRNISSLFGVFSSGSQRKLPCVKEIPDYLQPEREFSVQLKRGVWTLHEEKIIY